MSLKKYGDRSDRAADLARRRLVDVEVLREAVKKGALIPLRPPEYRSYINNPKAALPIEQSASRVRLDPKSYDLRDLLRAVARIPDRKLREAAQVLLKACNEHSHEGTISKQQLQQIIEAEITICDYFGAHEAKAELEAIGRLMTADEQESTRDGYARSMADRQALRDKLAQKDRAVPILYREIANLTAERADLAAALANSAAECANLTEALADSNAHRADLTEALADSNAHRAALEDRLREVNALLAFREAELEEMRQQIDDLRQQLQKKCTVPELAMIMVGVMADDIGRALAAAGQKYMERFPLSEEQADAYQVVLNQEYEQTVMARALFLRLVEWLQSKLSSLAPRRA